jgi:surface protein
LFGAGGSSLYGNDMVLVMATTAPAETVTIPCQNVGTFNAEIDWGDDSTSTITTYNDVDLAHQYADAGDHTIRISGSFPNIYFANTGDKLKLKEIIQLGKTGLTRMDAAFRGCSNLTALGGGAVDTSAVTTMKWAFLSCSSLASVNTRGWNTANVTSFESLFQTSAIVTPPATERWNTAKATTIAYMLNGCTSMTTAPDTSGWDTSKVTTMAGMFAGCASMATAPDTSGWDTGLVTLMSAVFDNCASMATAPDVSGWDTSAVTTMANMFQSATAMPSVDISGWNIELVADFTNFLANATLTTATYDATLIAWDAQNPIDSLAVHFGNSKYTGGGVAAAARANLESTDLWTITDGGIAP